VAAVHPDLVRRVDPLDRFALEADPEKFGAALVAAVAQRRRL
jgi:hypothetical protein